MLKRNDMLVFNDSRVIPARIFCKMKNRTATFELLLLRRIEPALWECMVRPGRKIMPGNVLYPVQRDGQPCSGEIEILETREGGLRTVRLSDERIIEESGNVPLPPYIHTPLEQAERYQTVYSR
jgi:S-adenosylmethionine:tRNA ribosyltransferase-isomerase